MNDSSDPASAEQQEGQPSELTCPECGGTLWEREDNGLLRFRCRVGHAYSPESMMVEQQRSLEQSLWAAVVALEERADLASRVEERMRRMGNAGTAERYRLRAQVARQHAQQVRAAIGGNEPDLDDATQ